VLPEQSRKESQIPIVNIICTYNLSLYISGHIDPGTFRGAGTFTIYVDVGDRILFAGSIGI